MSVVEIIRGLSFLCLILLVGMAAVDFSEKKTGKGLLMIGFALLLISGLAINYGFI